MKTLNQDYAQGVIYQAIQPFLAQKRPWGLFVQACKHPGPG